MACCGERSHSADLGMETRVALFKLLVLLLVLFHQKNKKKKHKHTEGFVPLLFCSTVALFCLQ